MATTSPNIPTIPSPLDPTQPTLDTLLSSDISKYHDLQVISEKIKSKGYYQSLLDLFLTIFREESLFTHSQLSQILGDRGEYSQSEIEEQFWVNSEVFRSNLVLIVNSMINSIWRSQELVQQVLEDGVGAEGLSSRREGKESKKSIIRKDQNLGKISESSLKSKSALKSPPNLGPGAKSKTTISVVKPEEENMPPYEFDQEYQDTANPIITAHYNLNQQRPQSGLLNQSATSGTSFKKRPGYKKEAFDRSQQSIHKDYKDYIEKYNSKRKSFERPSNYSDRASQNISANETFGRRKSREYNQTYSSVYSRILNAEESNKVRKLVGEHNADLDVKFFNFRANF